MVQSLESLSIGMCGIGNYQSIMDQAHLSEPDCFNFNDMAKELSASNNPAGSKFPDVPDGFPPYVSQDIPEMMKRETFQSSSTHKLFRVVIDTLDEHIERKVDTPLVVSFGLKLHLLELEERAKGEKAEIGMMPKDKGGVWR